MSKISMRPPPSVIVGIVLAAADVEQGAKKIPHRRLAHEPVVLVVRPVAGPDFCPRLDVPQRDDDKIRIDAELADAGVLKMGLDAVDLARREIGAAHVAAEILAVEVAVRLGFLPRAFGNRTEVMIAEDRILRCHQPPAQLADHLAGADRRRSEKSIARVGNRRGLDHRALVELPVDLQHRHELHRLFFRESRQPERQRDQRRGVFFRWHRRELGPKISLTESRTKNFVKLAGSAVGISLPLDRQHPRLYRAPARPGSATNCGGVLHLDEIRWFFRVLRALTFPASTEWRWHSHCASFRAWVINRERRLYDASQK